MNIENVAKVFAKVLDAQIGDTQNSPNELQIDPQGLDYSVQLDVFKVMPEMSSRVNSAKAA